MYLKLIRNQPKGSAITGRLFINTHYFCDTLERKGYEILALCYPVRVTHSPKFKRLLPIVQNVPRSAPAFTEDSADEPKASASGGNLFRRTESESSEPNEIYKISAPKGQGDLRTGIRFHRGTKPEHSTGCILVVADNNPSPLHSTPYTLHSPKGRTSADVEQELTRLILKAQNAHEEILLEIIDPRSATDCSYAPSNSRKLQKP